MVLPTPKNLTSKIPRRFSDLNPYRSNLLTADDVKAAREHIKNYWPKLIRSNLKDDDSLVGLPKPYLVPASEEGHDFDFNELYYWDSYFMIQGMLEAEHKEL